MHGARTGQAALMASGMHMHACMQKVIQTGACTACGLGHAVASWYVLKLSVKLHNCGRQQQRMVPVCSSSHASLVCAGNHSEGVAGSQWRILGQTAGNHLRLLVNHQTRPQHMLNSGASLCRLCHCADSTVYTHLVLATQFRSACIKSAAQQSPEM